MRSKTCCLKVFFFLSKIQELEMLIVAGSLLVVDGANFRNNPHSGESQKYAHLMRKHRPISIILNIAVGRYRLLAIFPRRRNVISNRF